MIDVHLGARDRRTAIVGGAVVLLLLVLGRAVPAWHRWRSNTQASTRASFAEASEARESVNRGPALGAANRRAELQRMEVAPAFVNGSGVAAAAANLASIVADAATANGMRVGALQASGDSAGLESGGVAYVQVRGDASGDVVAVTRFLAALEGGVPLLAVRELSVSQGEQTPSADRPESLHVEFVIDALAHFELIEPTK